MKGWQSFPTDPGVKILPEHPASVATMIWAFQPKETKENFSRLEGNGDWPVGGRLLRAVANPFAKPKAAEKRPIVRVQGEPTTTVILGGGSAGVVAGDQLRERRPNEYRIVIASRSEQHLFSTSHDPTG